MKTRIIIALLALSAIASAEKPKTEIIPEASYGVKNTGTSITIQFEKGKEHNHPLFAIWLADSGSQ